MRVQLAVLVVISALCGYNLESSALEYGHTTQPRAAKNQTQPVQETAATPEAATQMVHTPCATGDCNTGFGVTKSTNVSIPDTSVSVSVQRVDCVKLAYKDEEYQDYEPQQYVDTEKFVYKVNVPVTKTGTQTKTGYKTETGSKTVVDCVTVPVTRTIKVQGCDVCGRPYTYDKQVTTYETRTSSRQVDYNYQVPYSYDEAYNYTVNTTEDRVGQRDVTKVKQVPVTKTRQVPVVEPDFYYVQKTVHTATYTVTSEFHSRVPKADGAAIEARQRQAAGAPQQ